MTLKTNSTLGVLAILVLGTFLACGMITSGKTQANGNPPLGWVPGPAVQQADGVSPPPKLPQPPQLVSTTSAA